MFRQGIKWEKDLKSVGLLGLQLPEKNHLTMTRVGFLGVRLAVVGNWGVKLPPVYC